METERTSVELTTDELAMIVNAISDYADNMENFAEKGPEMLFAAAIFKDAVELEGKLRCELQERVNRENDNASKKRRRP